MARPKGSKNKKPGKKAAAKPKPKAAQLPQGAAPAGGTTAKARQIGANSLKSLLSTCRTTGEKVASINGTVRNEIKAAVDGKHLDPYTFAIIRKLDKLSPEKLNSVLNTLALYLDLSGLNARADSAQPLPLDGQQPEADGDEDGDDAEGDETALEGEQQVSNPAYGQPGAAVTPLRPRTGTDG